jgi:hypothetical protein
MNVFFSALAIISFSIENIQFFSLFGVAICYLVSIFNIRTNLGKLDKRIFIDISIVTMLYFYIVIYSLVLCFDNTALTSLSLAIKIFGVSFFVATSNRTVLSKAIAYAIAFHTIFFILQWLSFFAGLDELYKDFVNPLTKTQFTEFKYIPFRATGLFDEPSLFGMTMISLFICYYFINKNLSKISLINVITLSTPVMLVSVLLNAYDLLRKSYFIRSVVVVLTLIFCFFLFQFFIFREQGVVFSPMALRTNHYIYLLESPNLLFGNGLCSAYGVFDLALSRDDLMNNYLSNFKDAGQLAYLLDRVGLAVFVPFFLFFFYRMQFKSFCFLLIFLALSKTTSLSPVVMFILCCSQFSYKNKTK